MHLNSKFIDLCRNRSVFRLVPFDQNEFENHTYKKPLDYFNFFWKKYEKFKKEYKKLKKKEINKLIGRINQDGLTLIPTKLYFSKGKIKVEIAVAKGKKLYDKRQVKKTRDWNREKARLLSKNNK